MQTGECDPSSRAGSASIQMSDLSKSPLLASIIWRIWATRGSLISHDTLIWKDSISKRLERTSSRKEGKPVSRKDSWVLAKQMLTSFTCFTSEKAFLCSHNKFTQLPPLALHWQACHGCVTKATSFYSQAWQSPGNFWPIRGKWNASKNCILLDSSFSPTCFCQLWFWDNAVFVL